MSLSIIGDLLVTEATANIYPDAAMGAVFGITEKAKKSGQLLPPAIPRRVYQNVLYFARFQRAHHGATDGGPGYGQNRSEIAHKDLEIN